MMLIYDGNTNGFLHLDFEGYRRLHCSIIGQISSLGHLYVNMTVPTYITATQMMVIDLGN